MPTPALELRAVEKSYGFWRPQAALRGVTLQIDRGECYGLAGQNGAGKTTLIKIMLGLIAPDAGEVRILGARPEDSEMRRRIGFVPESAELPPSGTPRALVRRFVRLRGLPKSDVEKGVETLRRLGLSLLLDRQAGNLSKGEKQRTLLSLALLGEPEMLVLDEPTDGLDPLGRALVREVIREECAAGRTVFLNSHLVSETERICTRVGILHRGKLVREERLHAESGARRTSAVRFAEPIAAGILQQAGARAASSAFEAREAQAAPAGTLALIDHGDARELNASIDKLRAQGALLVELKPLKADIESALAEVAQLDLAPADLTKSDLTDRDLTNADLTNGDLTLPRHSKPELAPLPELPFRPLRTAKAIYRVGAEIAADLVARKLGWLALGFATVCAIGFLFILHSQLILGLAAGARIFGLRRGDPLSDKLFVQTIGMGAAVGLFWATLFWGVCLSSLFAPPLLAPRRLTLFLAQPITQSDFASGLYAAVIVLSFASSLFYAGLLFFGLRTLGVAVPVQFLLEPLPWIVAFAAVYAVVLAITFVFKNGVVAGTVGVGFFFLCTGIGQAPQAKPGGRFLWVLAHDLLPRVIELGRVAYDLGGGGSLSHSPFLFTSFTIAALFLLAQLAARRSEP